MRSQALLLRVDCMLTPHAPVHVTSAAARRNERKGRKPQSNAENSWFAHVQSTRKTLPVVCVELADPEVVVLKLLLLMYLFPAPLWMRHLSAGLSRRNKQTDKALFAGERGTYRLTLGHDPLLGALDIVHLVVVQFRQAT
jgi:hypothetical protein